jgi:hypothetical protein
VSDTGTQASEETHEDDEGATTGEGGAEGSGNPFPDPSAPPPPHPDNSELTAAIREQNKILAEQAKIQGESLKMTKELHDAVFSDEDGTDQQPSDPAKTKPTIVEPEPPAQPHTVPVAEGDPPKPEKRGWKKFY